MSTQIKKQSLSNLMDVNNKITQCFSESSHTTPGNIISTTPPREGLFVIYNDKLYASGKWDNSAVLSWKPISSKVTATIKFIAKLADGKTLTKAYSTGGANVSIPINGTTISKDSIDEGGEFVINIDQNNISYLNSSSDIWVFKLNNVAPQGTIAVGYEDGNFIEYTGALPNPLKGILSDMTNGGIKNLGTIIVNPQLLNKVNISVQLNRGAGNYPQRIRVYKMVARENTLEQGDEALGDGFNTGTHKWTGYVKEDELPYIKVVAEWSDVTYFRIYPLPCKSSENTISISQDNIHTDDTHWMKK